jgi:spectinomycin phosphotransferase
VPGDGAIAVIDWDEVMLAPPERDMMFVRGSAIAGVVTDHQATAFEAGYGRGDPDRLLIAWYRVDWAVQDLADFGRRVLLDAEAGDATRAYALELFEAVFEPGGEAATAIAADEALA